MFPKVKYEPERISFVQPEKERHYVPDFQTGTAPIYIEAKGKLDLDTRQKMLWFRESNPEVEIIFLFQNPSNKITKRSRTTYGEWAEANGFKWLDARKNWLPTYVKILEEYSK